MDYESLPVISTLLLLGNDGASPHGILLHLELNLAVRALGGCYIIEPLYTQNISKVNSLVDPAARAGTVDNLVIGEEEFVGDSKGSLVDGIGSEKEKDEGVETDEGLDDLKSKGKPSDG